MFSKIGWRLDRFVWNPLLKLFYGDHYSGGWYRVKNYLVWQKVLRINSDVPWFVHPTSRVLHWNKIIRKDKSNPGASIGNYIQATNGIKIGINPLIGPNVGIISANHSRDKDGGWIHADSIEIGDNVWIGMNSVVLPGVKIGDNVVIGAGSIVTKNIPSNSFAAGNPCKVIKTGT